MKTASNIVYRFLSFFLFINCCVTQGTTRFHNALFNEPCDLSTITLFTPAAAGKNIILGANANGMQESSLILLDSANQLYRGIAEKKVMVNSQQDSDNPLYDTQIALLTTQPLGSDPIVVTADAPTRLCFARNAHSAANYNVLTLENIKDSLGEECSKIVGIAAMPANLIFAAVQGKDAIDFGDKGSGIAIIQIKETKQENKSVIFELKQIDTLKSNESIDQVAESDKNSEQSNNKTEEKKSSVAHDSNGTWKVKKTVDEEQPVADTEIAAHAIPLDFSSDAVKINHDLAYIDNTIDMVWDTQLNVLYAALHVKSANHDDAGAQALVVIKWNSGEWKIEPFAPATTLSVDKNTIFGALGADKEITLHKLCTMRNSAELPYLLVLGGTGTPEQTKHTVYALPVFAKKEKEDDQEAAYGHMAKKKSSIKVANPFVKHPTAHYTFFDQNATTQEDAFLADDAAAVVGGGALKEGPISSIIAHHDLVYAMVSSADEGCLPGVFVSRALMDATGTITAWTAWQRVAGITDAVLGATVQEKDGSIIFYCKDNDTQTIAVKQTSWLKDEHIQSQLEKTIKNHFTQGIGSMVNFHADRATEKAPHLAILGNNKIAIVKTGYINNGAIIPVEDNSFTNAVECANGSIDKELTDTSILVISGGALQDIAPLTSVALVQNETEEWLLVGGTKGVAVLTDDLGNGFIRTGDASNSIISSIKKPMSFKKVSSCRFVCKIMGDRSHAYVLTKNGLERINLTSAPFKNGLQSTVLASSKDLLKGQGCFFDMIISEKLAILATSAGMVRIANGKDIASVQSELDAQWQYIPLREQMGATLHFDIQSSSGRAQDVSRGQGGMFYVLDSAYGKNRARVHRVVVESTQGEAQVTDATVTPALDIFPGKNNSSHVTLSSSRKKIATDGALLLSFPSPDKNKLGIVSGGTMRGHVNNLITLPVETGEIETLVRESASGRWFVGGSFGLLIHE